MQIFPIEILAYRATSTILKKHQLQRVSYVRNCFSLQQNINSAITYMAQVRFALSQFAAW
ncbi:hypothetical protein TUMSATVNIG1_48220 [Vibrio nigripulchritudo]|nr:hypothetical protein VNTUMSATTG_47860 [Vibrio nigripulchritudo]BDU34213.1 hypothetical protein TUMSATVNIG1_48220 [Vibrio nigripulchritudo]